MARLRARQFMYVQDLNHLQINFKDLDDILLKCGCIEYAWILHDKDKDEHGNLIRPHIHVDLKFNNPRDISSISQIFNDQDQYVQVIKGAHGWANMLAYLCHRTINSIAKYQYDPSEVHANFDYAARLKIIMQKAQHNKVSVKNEIERYANGEIKRDELIKLIGNFAFAKNKNLIDNIESLLLQQEYEEWVKKFHNSGKKMFVYWLWGEAGAGKSRVAKWLLEKREYAVLGDSRDPFEQYHGEHYIILDDFRPNEGLSYSDLLRVLDPYNFKGRVGSARYHSKLLSLAGVVITCPYSVKQFWETLRIPDRTIDTVDQLKRRVTVEVEITPPKASAIIKNGQRPKQLQ